jgi:hypothetical protein
MWRAKQRPPARTPLLWLAVCCEEWACSRAVAEQSWQALTASRWSRAHAMRLWFLAQPYVNVHQVYQTYTPQRLVGILEDLVVEQRLTRQQATALEEGIFAALTPDGEWREKGPTYASGTT